MTVFPSVPPFSVVVARLRAARCVFAEDEARLLLSAAREPAELDTMIERRVTGLPLEHVLRWAEFCGLRIVVDPGVFVPRRRTELLVHQAAELVRQRAGAVDAAAHPSVPVVVDLCCGSGAVGTALAAILGQVDLYAAEIDLTAVRCAHRNVIPAGGQVVEGDLYEALPATLRGRIDVLVANAPYVPTEAIGRAGRHRRRRNA
jgi:release factor glutamine methyltransferase